jgi:hypothetical protein
MKEHTESISDIIFTHFPSSQTRNHSRAKQTNLFINFLKKQVLLWKNQLQNCVASLGIGVVLLITVYLFFIQLAEYGWK